MNKPEEVLQIIADEFSLIGDPDMQLAAHVLKGFLRLPKSRQIEIAMLGQGVPVKLAADIKKDMAMEELMLATADRAEFCKN